MPKCNNSCNHLKARRKLKASPVCLSTFRTGKPLNFCENKMTWIVLDTKWPIRGLVQVEPAGARLFFISLDSNYTPVCACCYEHVATTVTHTHQRNRLHQIVSNFVIFLLPNIPKHSHNTRNLLPVKCFLQNCENDWFKTDAVGNNMSFCCITTPETNLFPTLDATVAIRLFSTPSSQRAQTRLLEQFTPGHAAKISSEKTTSTNTPQQVFIYANRDHTLWKLG
jgi:hypothetical protein